MIWRARQNGPIRQLDGHYFGIRAGESGGEDRLPALSRPGQVTGGNILNRNLAAGRKDRRAGDEAGVQAVRASHLAVGSPTAHFVFKLRKYPNMVHSALLIEGGHGLGAGPLTAGRPH
jgi:hypothetical protein